MPTLRTIQGYIYEKGLTVRVRRLRPFKLENERLYMDCELMWKPCCILYKKGYFHLWASLDVNGDFMVDKETFLKALAGLQSVELLKEWESKTQLVNA